MIKNIGTNAQIDTVVLIILSIVIVIFAGFVFYGAVVNYVALTNSSCHQMTITNTFKDITGGAGAYIRYRYFITDDSNVPYQLSTYTPLEIQKWDQIKLNQSYSLKTYNGIAEWC